MALIKNSIRNTLNRVSLNANRMSAHWTQTRSQATDGSSLPGWVEDDVLFTNQNMARIITLNRPKKLNSLNTSMVSKITPRLIEYSKSNVNNVVILNSTSPKGLCAGGDVAEVAKQIINGNPMYGADFFRREYNLNYLISTYPKPYISLMDGITMGGGVGLSVHAPFRIATERTKLTMPEMDIGLFPDVGTTFFLPRLDDKVGYYIALTGDILSGLDSYMLGFASHYVPSERLPHLVNRLSNLQPPSISETKPEDNHASIVNSPKEYFALVNHVIEEFSENKVPENYKFPFTAEQLRLINEAFSKPTVEEVFKCFESDGSEFSRQTLKKLSLKSPTSLRLALELLKRGLQNTISQQLRLELITASNLVHVHPESSDLVKGVSHKLINKIKEPSHPKWTELRQSGGISSEITKFFEVTANTSKLESPLIERFFGVSYSQYPYNMGLPTNAQIRDYITGNDGSGRSFLPTPKEVLGHFVRTTNNKLGVELKVLSTLALHGKASEYDNKYVSWSD